MSSQASLIPLDYRICDVFTSTPLHGNQLAVFENAGDLTTAEMQALAKEMNLSETTFILRRQPEVEQREGIRVRIFTTGEELPFAGHPTLGTAAIIRNAFPEYSDAAEIILDLNVGKVPVRFAAPAGPAVSHQASSRAVYGSMTQPKPVFGKIHNRETVAQAISLPVEDISPDRPIQTVSTGLPQCIVPLRSLDALGRLQVSWPIAQSYLAQTDARFFYCIAQPSADPTRWRARMQFYDGEDPATGSAAGCAISYLVQHRFVRSGQPIHLRQGVEINRPSDLYLQATQGPDGQIHEVTVSGSTVPVAKGQLFLERFTHFQQA